LAKKGVSTGFFFPEGRKSKSPNEQPDYLNPSHERYAPKLAAAVRAWQAFEKHGTPAGKSAKQALTGWVTEHAALFELQDEDGKLNANGIDQIASVANWQPTGGAPKTPGST
jgi:hypothetical protein